MSSAKLIFRNTAERYGLVAKLLHWMVAIVVMGLFAVGVWMVELTYYDPWYKPAPFYHKSIGTLLAFVFLFRFLWRCLNVIPKVQASHKLWEQLLSRFTHVALYILIFSIIASGYLISTADGRSIDVLGWFDVPAFRVAVENQEDIAGEFHQWLAYILMGLVLLHVLAAFKHHFIDHDETLRRML